jgi:predicted transcriptional regulator
LKPPCLIIAGLILPALRVEIAKSLIKDYNLKPIMAARKMDVTPAAITQYVKGVRGKEAVGKIFQKEDVKQGVNTFVNELMKDPSNHSDVLSKLCSLCKYIRREGLICDACRDLSPESKNIDCDFCKI